MRYALLLIAFVVVHVATSFAQCPPLKHEDDITYERAVERRGDKVFVTLTIRQEGNRYGSFAKAADFIPKGCRVEVGDQDGGWVAKVTEDEIKYIFLSLPKEEVVHLRYCLLPSKTQLSKQKVIEIKGEFKAYIHDCTYTFPAEDTQLQL